MAQEQSAMALETDAYSSAYKAALVLPMLQRVCSKAGLDLVSRALQLYYLARSPDIPAWAKASIFAALG